jgi:hypothetical protein
VSRILEHKCASDVLLFKVRWSGFAKNADTWEPEDSFIPGAEAILDSYLKCNGLPRVTFFTAQHFNTPLKNAFKKGQLQKGGITLTRLQFQKLRGMQPGSEFNLEVEKLALKKLTTGGTLNRKRKRIKENIIWILNHCQLVD